MYLLLALSAESHALPVFGRDYWPYHQDATASPQVVASATIYDALKFGGKLWVLYRDTTTGDIEIIEYTLNDAMISSATTVLSPDTSSGSHEANGFSGASVQLCSKESKTGDVLTADGIRWVADHIGLNPGSISITGTGGSCPSASAQVSSFIDGWTDGTDTEYDSFEIDNEGTCTTFTASYDYTNCSFTGSDAFNCPMDADNNPVTDEWGYCRFFLVYDGMADLDSDSGTPDDHQLFMAHAQDLDGEWVRYLPSNSGNDYPGANDVLISSTGPHNGSTDDEVYSFTGVPELAWDTGVWRMWFVSEDTNGNAIRYSESDDNGMNWGIGSYDQPIDCWDPDAGDTADPGDYDTDACVALEWTGTEPPDFDDSNRDPDVIDPAMFLVDVVGSAAPELGMMFAGADDGCDATSGEGDERVVLFAYHEEDGDQSGGDKWNWVSAVEADSSNGVVLEEDTTICEMDYSTNDGDDRVADPTIVKWAANRYVMFFQMNGGIYVSGSGFQCSNFKDDETPTGDGNIDYGDGTGEESASACESPTDDSE